MSQTAGLYVESPIEARGGLRIGSGAVNGTITVGATTGATADRLVQRDSAGDIYSRYSFAVHFNQSGGNSENPTIGQIWTQNTTDNYVRKSSPAHFRSQITDGVYVYSRGTNWNDGTVIGNTVGMLSWKNYGNGHVIFDASASTSPSGASINNTNSAAAWTGTYPTLMGWNGSQTYGVRVDSARVADSASSASSVPWTGVSAGIRENYDLQFRPADNSSSYAGFAFASPGNSSNGGYFLIRGGADSDVYTQNGITLVADLGWLTLAQRTTANRGVRIMTGSSTSSVRISVTDSFSTFSNGIRFGGSTNNAYLTGNSDWGFRVINDNGYIQFGPANNSWSHIYSDKSFYFNQELYVNGTQVVKNSGTWSISITGNAATVDSRSVGTSTNNIPFLSGTRNLVINNPESYSGEVRLGAAWDRGGVYASNTLSLGTSSSAIDFVFSNTVPTSMNSSGAITFNNFNTGGIRVTSSGSTSSGAAFAIQQVTSEGWTGVFVDYEPYTGWGLYHDNPNNYF
jgi:hypothetical protein